MDSILRETDTNNWVTLVFLGLLLVVVILKARNTERLHRNVFSLFNKGALEIEMSENYSVFSAFTSLLFLFFTTIYSLTIYFLQDIFVKNPQKGFSFFASILIFVIVFFLIKRGIEFLLISLFSIEVETKKILFSIKTYQYSISFFLLIALVFYLFGIKNIYLLLGFVILLFLVKFAHILINNKNLILSELFYFILYLCTFEIAPLLILYKLML